MNHSSLESAASLGILFQELITLLQKLLWEKCASGWLKLICL